MVVLKAAKLEGEKLTFDVAVLEGSLGKADGPASVFIDTIWFGVGSQRLQLLRHEPDHRRRDAGHRRSARHQHVQRLVQPLAHPSRTDAAARRATAPRSARRRRPTSIRATSSATTRRPAARPRCCPATEARVT